MNAPSIIKRSIFIGVALLAMLIAPLSGLAQQVASQWSRPVDAIAGSGADNGSFTVLLCDQYQDAYMLVAEQSLSGAAILYRNDVEGSWSVPRDVIATADEVAFGLGATINNRDDSLHAIWLNRYLSGDLIYTRAALRDSANPRSWELPLTLANAVDWAAIQADSRGLVHIVYGATDASGIEHTVYHIQSDDSGLTWSEPVSAYTGATAVPSIIRPEIAIDGRNRLHVGMSINSNDYGVYSEVGYVQSADGGTTWSAYKQVQTLGTTFQGVAWISPFAFGDDEVHLTWHDPRRMHAWSTDGGVTWRGPIEIMPLAAAFGGRNFLTQDSAGVLHVVTAVADGVFSAAWDGAEWGTPEQIDTRYIDPHGQSIMACQGNQLHVAFYDRTGDNKTWYSTRLVNAPHLDRKPMPTPTPQPTPTISANAGATAGNSAMPVVSAAALENLNRSEPEVNDPLQPVILPILAVGVLLVVVAVVRQQKARR
ncbi:MAG: exo-alpha-sialidase [Thermoflexales bacterium]|nr:exo-alpha-sialidase [Thermoflexales bacterium]